MYLVFFIMNIKYKEMITFTSDKRIVNIKETKLDCNMQ